MLPGEALPSVMKKVVEAALPGATRQAPQEGQGRVTEIRHIVFDLGNVLLDWDPEIPYRRLIPDEEKRRWFLDRCLQRRLEPRAGPRPPLARGGGPAHRRASRARSS